MKINDLEVKESEQSASSKCDPKPEITSELIKSWAKDICRKVFESSSESMSSEGGTGE